MFLPNRLKFVNVLLMFVIVLQLIFLIIYCVSDMALISSSCTFAPFYVLNFCVCIFTSIFTVAE